MLRGPPPAEGQLVLLRGPVSQLPPEPMFQVFVTWHLTVQSHTHSHSLTHTPTHTLTCTHTHTIPHSQCTHVDSHLYILSPRYILIIHMRSVTHVLTIYSGLHTHTHKHPHAGLNFAEQSTRLPSAQEFSSTPVPLKRRREITSRSPCS